jgi:hypothetical protein
MTDKQKTTQEESRMPFESMPFQKRKPPRKRTKKHKEIKRVSPYGPLPIRQ